MCLVSISRQNHDLGRLRDGNAFPCTVKCLNPGASDYSHCAKHAPTPHGSCLQIVNLQCPDSPKREEHKAVCAPSFSFAQHRRTTVVALVSGTCADRPDNKVTVVHPAGQQVQALASAKKSFENLSLHVELCHRLPKCVIQMEVHKRTIRRFPEKPSCFRLVHP